MQSTKMLTRQSRAARAHDAYYSPDTATGPLLRALGPHAFAGAMVLDPACGDGALVSLAKAMGAWDADGFDLHGSMWPNRNALDPEPWFEPGVPPWARVVLMNPPYKHAQAFFERAIAEVGYDGRVYALLRLAFLESVGRVELHQRHPSDVLVLAKRPSFTGDGRTDATAYAWFCWPGRREWKVVT